MKCPNDAATLVMSERSGVEIDYCPECRGVWLDRGELDKILDRAAAESLPAAPPAHASFPTEPAPFPAEPEYRSRYSEPFPESRGDRRDDDRSHGGYGDRRGDDRSYGGYGDRPGQGQYRRKRKDSWLSELFD